MKKINLDAIAGCFLNYMVCLLSFLSGSFDHIYLSWLFLGTFPMIMCLIREKQLVSLSIMMHPSILTVINLLIVSKKHPGFTVYINCIFISIITLLIYIYILISLLKIKKNTK